MYSIRRLILILFAAALASAETPAVKKVLGTFNDLNRAKSTKQKVQFYWTEGELNEYLQSAQKTNPRPGLDSLSIKLFPANYISTFTVIDFDAVEKWRPGTVPGLLKPVLHGKKAIWVDVRVNANNGQGTFAIEKAYFENIRLPAFMVEKMISVVASRQREKYDTSKPVPLPFGLQKIWTGEKAVAGEN